MFYIDDIKSDKALVVDTEDWKAEWHTSTELFELAKQVEIKGVDTQKHKIHIVGIEELFCVTIARDKLCNVQSTFYTDGYVNVSFQEPFREHFLVIYPVGAMTYRVPEGVYTLGGANNVKKGVPYGVHLHESVQCIGADCFEHESIRSINLENVSLIAEQAFFDCKNLNEITLSQDLHKLHIDESAFKSSGLRVVNIYGDALSIPEDDFKRIFRSVGHEVRICSKGSLLYVINEGK